MSLQRILFLPNKLAEHCKYGCLREKMIRDRIVVGIGDAKLSEKLQLNPKLDLATAIVQGRQHEDVKKPASYCAGSRITRPSGCTVI